MPGRLHSGMRAGRLSWPDLSRMTLNPCLQSFQTAAMLLAWSTKPYSTFPHGFNGESALVLILHVVSNEQPEGQEGFDRRPVTRSQMRRREAGARSRQARLAAKNPRERRSEREIPQDRHSPIPKAKKLKTWWIVTGLFVVIAVISIVVGLIWLK